VTDVTASALADALRDRYRLERELGRGGMATVYLASDLRHDRPVALKVLHPELAATLGPDRFLREIRIAARLQHPHILPLHDSGEGAGQLWYTMPYVDGESLRDRLRREIQLPLDVALGIARQIAGALDYAHQLGVVHRDIKPENVLLSRDQVLVTDFGIAKALDAAGGEKLTETGLSLGTPAYMSPEQASAGQVDGRSDIYALGCVVYEMLAGEPPFTGPTAQAIIAKRFGQPVPRLRAVRETVPESVDRAVELALAKVPADRFATAGEFGAALDLREDGERARTPPLRRPAAARRRSRLLFVSGAIALVALVASALTLLRTRAPATVDPNLLAVAPFDVLDPSLELWREGLADVLSRDLDGAGPLRTISPTVALRRWQGRADQASAEALSRRTGAGLVVFGAVVPSGRDSVSLRASVLDGTRARSATEVEVSGVVPRMGELADSLGYRILRALGQSRPIGSVRQVSIGSRSLPALKAFLQGEQFYRRGLWDSALVHYHEAIAADSNFGLAYYRMTLVLGWNPPTAGAYRPGEQYARQAELLNHGISPRESLLIAAGSLAFPVDDVTTVRDFVTSPFRAMAALEEAVRRYPQDPEAWYALGEARYHLPRPVATAPAQTLEAFERAIALDSGFGPAYEHLLSLTIKVGRPDLARRYAARYLSLDPTGESATSVRLAALLLGPQRARAPETAALIDTASIHTLFSVGVEHLGSWPDSGETAVWVLRKIGEGRRAPGGDAPFVLDSLMWPQYVAKALTFRGHLREAYQTDRQLLLHPEASAWSGFLDPFLDLSLFGVIPDSMASATFKRSLEPSASWEPFTPRHLRGLPWWLARRDTTSLARFAQRAAEVARRPTTPEVALRARLLGAAATAYLALGRGDSAGALQRLEAIPDTLCLADGFAANCFHVKLALARLLSARGEYRRAGDLLDRWRWDANGPFFTIATLELGRIAEEMGERGKAIESYQFVVDGWRRADPELQPYVAEAREALERLRKD
jgi:eukaryotic-like serine/threonine-protein kinase